MLESFLAFNQNAVSHILYILQSNIWFSLLLIGLIATIAMLLHDDVLEATRDEQRIL